LRPAVLEAIRELPNVTVESESGADSGFRVVSTSGSVVVDATLETRLERLASSLAIEIHERLQER
jgi:vacuolar-type H+-ATPase subunit E/Vma4